MYFPRRFSTLAYVTRCAYLSLSYGRINIAATLIRLCHRHMCARVFLGRQRGGGGPSRAVSRGKLCTPTAAGRKVDVHVLAAHPRMHRRRRGHARRILAWTGNFHRDDASPESKITSSVRAGSDSLESESGRSWARQVCIFHAHLGFFFFFH